MYPNNGIISRERVDNFFIISKLRFLYILKEKLLIFQNLEKKTSKLWKFETAIFEHLYFCIRTYNFIWFALKINPPASLNYRHLWCRKSPNMPPKKCLWSTPITDFFWKKSRSQEPQWKVRESHQVWSIYLK